MQKKYVWKYAYNFQVKHQKVSRKFIICIFKISSKILRGIQDKIDNGKCFEEKRGKQLNRKNK